MGLKDPVSSHKIVFMATTPTLALQEPTKGNLGQPYSAVREMPRDAGTQGQVCL